LKQLLDGALTEAIAGVATGNRIVHDTGGGATVSFLTDPEDALLAGFLLRGALAAARVPVRLGINFGPVAASHANLFSPPGTRIDKDQREHEVYAVLAIGSDSIRSILESRALRRHRKQTEWTAAAFAWFRNLFT